MPSSEASTPPTPTASAWRWSPSSPPLPTGSAACCWRPAGPGAAHQRAAVRCSTRPAPGWSRWRRPRRQQPVTPERRVSPSSPVMSIGADGPRWRVDDEPADAVVLATPAHSTSELVAGSAPAARRAARAGRRRERRDRHAVRAGLAVAGARDERLPRPEAGPAPRDRGVVRVAEVGPLAGCRRDHACRRSAATGSTSTASTMTGSSMPRSPSSASTSTSTCSRPRRGSAAGHARSRSTGPAISTGSLPSTQRRRRDCFSPGPAFRGIGVPACIADAERTAEAVVQYLAVAD